MTTEKPTNEKEIDYENPWIFEGQPFLSEDIDDYYGFVYCITNSLTGKRYIGRKYFQQLRKPRTGGRRVKSESDWKRYYGSSAELSEERKRFGNLAYRRDIISLHKTKGLTNFEETRQLFLNNVLTEAFDDGTPAFYNSNILGRYMRKDYFKTGTQNP